jgi:hypothetical protein
MRNYSPSMFNIRSRLGAGWGARVRFPKEARDFCLHHSVQTDSGAHPVFYTMGTGGSFPRLKRLGREADHSPPSNAEAKDGGAIPPLSRTSPWRGAY